MKALLAQIGHCQLCKGKLPHLPRPVIQASATARLVIAGQAPGRRVHESGIPWNDPSGDRLRQWLQMEKTVFYDARLIGLIPAAFCYPGTGKNGDLPPPKICAPTWHPALSQHMTDVKLTLLVGQYSQHYYLGKKAKKNLTETVKAFESYLPNYFPLPHPSPRNQLWLKQNPWFEECVLPVLQAMVQHVLVAC